MSLDELNVKAVKLVRNYLRENKSMAEARREQVKVFMDTQNRTKYHIEERQPISERPADTVKGLEKYYEELEEIKITLKNQEEDLKEENAKERLDAMAFNLLETFANFITHYHP